MTLDVSSGLYVVREVVWMDAMCWSPTTLYQSACFVDDVMCYMCSIDYNTVCSVEKKRDGSLGVYCGTSAGCLNVSTATKAYP